MYRCSRTLSLQLFIFLSPGKCPIISLKFRFSCNILLQITLDMNGLSVIEVWKHQLCPRTRSGQKKTSGMNLEEALEIGQACYDVFSLEIRT